MPDPTPTGSISRAAPAPLADPQSDAAAEALADQRHGDLHRAARPRGAAGIPRLPPPASSASPPLAQPRPAAGIEGTLARLQASLDRVEARQTAALNTLEERYDTKAKRMRGVLADLGIDGKKRRPPSPPRSAARSCR